ncbi:ATP-binding protein [[Micrococcus luteus] ATCC 49442]|uniref:ATP-binding protein n=1 Tax=[Micrococcus luteus] ATCC 49442 TaxID=2698727 RepID=UPI0013DAFDBB|nr:ATP-binding protein [[Micrococcus luteus] ATCC 49442]
MHFGQRVGQGEVGEFFIVEAGGRGIFGRLIEVTRVGPVADTRDLDRREGTRGNWGRVQLLSTVENSGQAQRGVAAYPRLGDRVFAASEEAVRAVISGIETDHSSHEIDMGTLTVGNGIRVGIPAEKLFGKHTAVVGATGSGKSWTLSHLAASASEIGGRMILIDATGEFRSLGAIARHLVLGSTDGEPDANLVSVPHWHMRETDRNAFISPSSGSQLPKLRSAIRSLRLRHLLDSESNAAARTELSHHLQSEGLFTKANQDRRAYDKAQRYFAKSIESPYSQFSLRHLARQLLEECVWSTDQQKPNSFGRVDANSQGYASTLVSRIEDLVQTPEIMSVVEDQSGASLLTEIKHWLATQEAGILRISLRNLTFSHNLREIIVNVLGHALLSMARRGDFRSNPVVVALDEAHQFFNVTVGDETTSHLDGFDLIAKEGRKYGLTVCLATQRPGDLPTAVLSQVGMLIVHRLADGRDRQRVEQAAAELDLSAMKLLPGLVPGEAIFMGVDFPVPVSVRVRKPKFPPESDGPQYSTGWRPCEPC